MEVKTLENKLEFLERIIKLHQLKIKELQALVKEAKKERNAILCRPIQLGYPPECETCGATLQVEEDD